MRKSDRELGRRERENVKLRETVGRYREKWENLRKSAKARREGGGGGSVAAPESLVREGADADGDED